MTSTSSKASLSLSELDGVVGGTKVTGTDGADQLITGAGDHHIVGGLGDDTITDFGGSESIEGGAGNDRINTYGAPAGDAWDDRIDGGWGHDTINAGAGYDIIYSTLPGSDYVEGGSGSDIMYWSPLANGTTFHAGNDVGGETEADWLILVPPDFYAGELGNPVVTYEVNGQTFTTELRRPGDSVGHFSTEEGKMSGTVTWGNSTITFTDVEAIMLGEKMR